MVDVTLNRPVTECNLQMHDLPAAVVVAVPVVNLTDMTFSVPRQRQDELHTPNIRSKVH